MAIKSKMKTHSFVGLLRISSWDILRFLDLKWLQYEKGFVSADATPR